MTAKAELRWVPKRVHLDRWVLGDVTHIESGRLMEADVALDEACQMFPDQAITVVSSDFNALGERVMIP